MKHLLTGVAVVAALAFTAPVWAQPANPSGGNAMGLPGPNPGGPGLTPYSGGAPPTSAPPPSMSETTSATRSARCARAVQGFSGRRRRGSGRRKPRPRRLNGLYKRDGPGVTNRAVCSFFAWLEQHGIGGLVDIEPFHVAAYIKALKVSDAGNPAVKERAAARPTVKQHLAAIRMLRGSDPKGLPR